MTYDEVVKTAQKTICNRLLNGYGYGKISYQNCPEWQNGDQINLWTYWQGYQIKDVDQGVDILLVGQDWGNPTADNNQKTMESIRAIQRGEDTIYFSDSTTDKNMVELFTCLECDITKKDPGKRLFFTNYSLGYRSGKQIGNMTKTLLRQDKELFESLVSAIKPRIIICLGKLVYETVSDKRVYTFSKTLTSGVPFCSDYPGNSRIKVYGVAHCGGFGSKNAGGMEKMKEVWSKIIWQNRY